MTFPIRFTAMLMLFDISISVGSQKAGIDAARSEMQEDSSASVHEIQGCAIENKAAAHQAKKMKITCLRDRHLFDG